MREAGTVSAMPQPKDRRPTPIPASADGAVRVLIVEDDAEMLQWVAEVLGEEGFQTVTAPDALSAIISLLADKVDVLVTDWRMPGYDGLRLLESARRLAPDTPVVFVTAYARPGLDEQVRGRGAFSLLEKPFSREELLLHVRSALRFGTSEAS